jgi:hypothetical protein
VLREPDAGVLFREVEEGDPIVVVWRNKDAKEHVQPMGNSIPP